MPAIVIQWPTSLPHNVMQSQFNFNPGSGVIRDEVDAGYPIVRRRYTGTVDRYSIALIMDYSELVIFKDFFRNSPGHPTLPGLFFGSIRVEFPEPLWYPAEGETEADRPYSEFRWITRKGQNPYTVSPDGESQDFVVSFELEKIQ